MKTDVQGDNLTLKLTDTVEQLSFAFGESRRYS